MEAVIDTKSAPLEFIPKDQVGTAARIQVNVIGLERELRRRVRGEVRFDDGSRAMYAHDASNYRMVPICVVLPVDVDDAVATVEVCHKYHAPLLGRGGGTGIPGQSVNSGVMIDFSKYMHDVLEIDPKRKIARVQPGCVLDTLRDAANKHGLTFGPDPATHTRCTLGGMIGNNSCGIHSVMAGRTVDNVESLDIILHDGTRMTVGATDDAEFDSIEREGGRRGDIYRKLRDLRDRYADEIRARYPKIPRRVSGYSLDELLPEHGFNVARSLVGTESTCAIVLEATVRLVDNPPVRSLLVLGFPDVFTAGDFVLEPLKYKPVALEGLDSEFIEDMTRKGLHDPNIHKLPKGRAWLLVEFGGKDKSESDRPAKELMEAIKDKPNAPSAQLFDDPKMEKHLWHLREEGLGATARVPGDPDNWEGWEDAAVPPDRVGDYLRDFKKLMDEYGYEGALYGHFGDGCIHTRLDFDLFTAAGIEKYRRFVEEAADLVSRYGGSLSGEHGDGQARGELLPRMYGDEIVRAFAEFKAIWDPEWLMNPGKMIAPFRLDENLNYGTRYDPPRLDTKFKYPDDKFSFAYATQRCVGAGVCRQHHGGTMCPSYMVTLEEKHSTRGRARMLFEMLEGDPIKDGWKSEEVKEALDLCLSCKGCKGDCPVQVDMATYKAEFLSHYYEGRVRPIHAYAFGLIHMWSRLASKAPLLVNLVTQTPGLRSIAKAIVGMPRERRIPAFAPETFKSWWARRPKSKIAGPRVILWPDTFNDHFHPSTAQAAVEVLENAGFAVDVPMNDMCCGRPLYDYGMLDTAKAYLRNILTRLHGEIEAGTPIVVLEPSCCAVFRDELLGLFPEDQDAVRLSKQTFLLSEFIEKRAPNYRPPKLKRRALAHGHCHHKSLMKMNDEESVLKKMEVDYKLPDPGCCGMAGAFGFEGGDHYDVSIKCGERVLLPAVRDADPTDLIIADGFSCREQIKQTTDRQALHLAQVIQMALRDGETGTPGPKPERAYVQNPGRPGQIARSVAAVGALATAGAVVWWLARRNIEQRARE